MITVVLGADSLDTNILVALENRSGQAHRILDFDDGNALVIEVCDAFFGEPDYVELSVHMDTFAPTCSDSFTTPPSALSTLSTLSTLPTALPTALLSTALPTAPLTAPPTALPSTARPTAPLTYLPTARPSSSRPTHPKTTACITVSRDDPAWQSYTATTTIGGCALVAGDVGQCAQWTNVTAGDVCCRTCPE